jgi:predicted dinucleotide-binding enzyme
MIFESSKDIYPSLCFTIQIDQNMSYKTFASMNIALIGTGVEHIAKKFAKAGHTVFIGNEYDFIQPLISSLPRNVMYTSIQAASAVADIIFIATTPDEVRPAVYQLGDVRKKVIIDYTAFMEGKPGSTAAAIRSITSSQHVIKCFAPTGYEDLLIPNINEQHADMYIAGTSKKAKAVAAIMAMDLGYKNHYDIGGNGAINMLDEMTQHASKNKTLQPVLVPVPVQVRK